LTLSKIRVCSSRCNIKTAIVRVPTLADFSYSLQDPKRFTLVIFKSIHLELHFLVPDRKMGSCLYAELPGTGLQEKGVEGPGPPCSGEKSQLEPSSYGENRRREKEEPIPDMMEDQRPTE
jgi:hypothetical protein